MPEPRELDLQALLALDLRAPGRLLVEAGAGTGKTYTLVSLHLRLVLAGVPVRRIGAVTFTNAATEELRGRLRLRLRQAWRGLRHGWPEAPPPWWPLVERAVEEDGPEAVRSRLREALAGLDEAPVHTLHGLCLRLLRRHPGLVEPEPVLDPDADDRLLEAACAFWRERVRDDPWTWRALQTLGAGTPEALLRTLGELLGREPEPWPAAPERVPPEALETASREREELEEALRGAWAAEGPALFEEILPQARLHRRGYKPEQLESLQEALAEWAEGHAELPPAKAGREALARACTASTPAAFRERLEGLRLPALVDRLQESAERQQALLRALGRGLLLEALREIPAAARRLRLGTGKLHPDDLPALTAEALEGPGGPELAVRVAEELSHLFVDEFQDTDPLQYRILRALEAAGTRLVLIGDPKQAIYAFRGADVHTYLRAREETPPQGRYRLTVNRRSRPAVCEAVNALFGRHPRPFVWEGLEHPPARAAEDRRAALEVPQELDPAPGAGLTLWTLAAPERPRPNQDEALARSAAEAARHIAALLAAARRGEALLDGDPVRPGQLAVLVRSHRQAQAVREALARHGIPAACTSRGSVFASAAAPDLSRWLDALAEPRQPALLRRALAAPLSGLDLPALRRALGEGWEAWLERAEALHALWRQRGVLACLQRLLDELGLEALAAREDGERLLTDLLHLGELLQRESGRLPEPAALAAWLRRQVAEPPRGEEAVLRLESEQGAVRVLTVHKAKGLEFPIVYLPFLWDAPLPKPSREGPTRPFHLDGRWRVAFGPEGREHADRERLGEELRLLYVALTRAAVKLYAWAGPVGEQAGRGPLDWLLHPAPAEETPFPFLCDPELGLQARKQEERAALEEACRRWRERLEALADGRALALASAPPPEPPPAPPPAAAAPPASGPLPEPVRDPWRITSYSGILRGEHRSADYDADEEEAESPATAGRALLPPGAATGNFLHRLLQETDFAEPRWEARREAVEALARRFGLSLEGGRWEELRRWLDGVLDAPLPEGLPLRGLTATDRLHEVGFHFRIRGARARELDALLRRHDLEPVGRWGAERLQGLLGGAIDLVYRRGGRYYVADFKSHLLPDYGQARLRQAVAERRYDLQALLYTLALHRHLRLRLPGYRYGAHLGGARYLFLRGMRPDRPGAGILELAFPEELVEGLDTLLEGGRP